MKLAYVRRMSFVDDLSREYTYISTMVRTLKHLRPLKADSQHTIVDIVTAQAAKTPDATVFYYLDRTVSYAELEASANRYANWAAATGIRRGEVVVLLMENRPEFVIAWLGLLKAGAIVALINTHLRGVPLAHSINIAEARHAIVGQELAASYAEVAPQIESHPTAWCTGGKAEGFADLDAALAAASPAAPDPRAACRHHAARTRRSTSTRPARRDCPRRRTSRICGCCI